MRYPFATWRPLPWYRADSIRPVGIVHHFTAGCGDAWVTLNQRQVSSHFWVGRDGSVEQYVDTDDRAWHAGGANELFIGVEHQALPGTCDLTDTQLYMSAALSAWLCWMYGIPLQRSYGAPLTPGFKAHNDGLDPAATWNPNRHYDGIWKPDVPWVTGLDRAMLERSPWTWDNYAWAVYYYEWQYWPSYWWGMLWP